MEITPGEAEARRIREENRPSTNPGTVRSPQSFACVGTHAASHTNGSPRSRTSPHGGASEESKTTAGYRYRGPKSRSATAAKPRRRLRGARQRQEQWHGAISTRSPREHRDLASTFLAGGSTVTNRWHARSRPPPRFWYVTTGKSWAKTRLDHRHEGDLVPGLGLIGACCKSGRHPGRARVGRATPSANGVEMTVNASQHFYFPATPVLYGGAWVGCYSTRHTPFIRRSQCALLHVLLGSGTEERS